jgi:hypothetical protein
MLNILCSARILASAPDRTGTIKLACQSPRSSEAADRHDLETVCVPTRARVEHDSSQELSSRFVPQLHQAAQLARGDARSGLDLQRGDRAVFALEREVDLVAVVCPPVVRGRPARRTQTGSRSTWKTVFFFRNSSPFFAAIRGPLLPQLEGCSLRNPRPAFLRVSSASRFTRPRASRSRVAFVQQSQTGERQHVVDLLDLLDKRDDQPPEPTGGDDRGLCPQLVIQTPEDRVDGSRVAVHDT